MDATLVRLLLSNIEHNMASAEGWSDSLMRYGLWFGAVFQLICILAIILFPSKKAQQLEVHSTQEYPAERAPNTSKVIKQKQKEKGARKRR